MNAGLDDLLIDPTFYADPYPVYALLRAESPVHWCEPWQQWVVTRADDVLAVLREPALFSSNGWEQRFLATLPAEAGGLPNLRRHYGTDVLSNTDPPTHTRLRRMLSRSFTPRVLDAFRPRISQVLDDTFARLEHGDSANVMAELAYPFPAAVIAELLGAPPAARPQFERWSADIVDFVGTGSPDVSRAMRADESLGSFRSLLIELMHGRSETPHDDLLSMLLEPDDDGAVLSTDVIVATAVTLLFAGHETTANLIANCLWCLARYPDQLSALRANPGLAGAAIEETLRFEAPVQRVRRLALDDVVLGGQRIRAGQPVMAFLGSANRDVDHTERPDEFRITRGRSNHVGFGHGIHFCIGAGLSRIEAPMALASFNDRFPTWELDGDRRPTFRHNITFRGLDSLQLRLR